MNGIMLLFSFSFVLVSSFCDVKHKEKRSTSFYAPKNNSTVAYLTRHFGMPVVAKISHYSTNEYQTEYYC